MFEKFSFNPYKGVWLYSSLKWHLQMKSNIFLLQKYTFSYKKQ